MNKKFDEIVTNLRPSSYKFGSIYVSLFCKEKGPLSEL